MESVREGRRAPGLRATMRSERLWGGGHAARGGGDADHAARGGGAGPCGGAVAGR